MRFWWPGGGSVSYFGFVGAVRPPGTRARVPGGRVHLVMAVRHAPGQMGTEWADTYETFTPCHALAALSVSRRLIWLPDSEPITCRVCLKWPGGRA
jgi:hypothetical protein